MAPNAFPENAEQNSSGSSGFMCETETFRRFLDSRIPIPGRVIPFFIGIHKSSFRSHLLLSLFKTIPAFPPPKSQRQTPYHFPSHTAPFPGFILHPNHFPSAVKAPNQPAPNTPPESSRQTDPLAVPIHILNLLESSSHISSPDRPTRDPSPARIAFARTAPLSKLLPAVLVCFFAEQKPSPSTGLRAIPATAAQPTRPPAQPA